jgi:hypothetical protein
MWIHPMAEDRRVLDADPLSGITTNFVYEDNGGETADNIVIESSQDVTQIIESNKRQRNAINRHQPHGEWTKVGSIPMTIYYDLKKKGILDDQVKLSAWLNDPDNRAFRTRVSRV